MGGWGHGFGLAAADKGSFDPKLLRRAMGFLKPYGGLVAGAVFCVVMVTVSDLMGPALLRRAIDVDIAAGSVPGLMSTLLLYLLSVVVNALATGAQTYMTGTISQWVIYELRSQVFSHLQTLSLSFYDTREMGDTISRLTNDVGPLNELISNGLITLANTLLSLGGVVISMMLMSVRLSLFTFSVMPLMLLISIVFRGWIGQAYREIRERVAEVTSRVEEGFAGVRIVQSFAQENRFLSGFRAVNEANRVANMDAAALRSVYFPAIEVVSTLGIVLVLWFGGMSILRHEVSVGVMVAFIFYLFRFFQPIRNLTILYDQVLAAMAASERIFELLDLEPAIVDPVDPVHLPRIEGHVQFDQVSFAYKEDEPVLREVDIEAKPGEMIAIVGATGAGKTTTISLLCRFYDVLGGAVLVDGHDLREIAIQSLRTQLGIVLQEGFLFSDTVRENIRYGRLEATDQEVEDAARAVGAHDYVMRLAEGYDTEVRERGAKLSMGERQLICLARALIADPRILILDEATSSIDPYTELVIQDALLKLFEGRTAIVIAHRLSTVRRADRIYVMDHGQVVEVGSHADLLSQDGIYTNLYEMQFKAQEEEDDGE